jgi:O-acetyl-ADP-ribose deacetylase (regulator of RNase III)
MVSHIIGNLLDSNCEYICQQVNCQGVMGSGIAKQIRERWPEVYESYRAYYESYVRQGHRNGNLLGTVSFTPVENDKKRVVNMYSQHTYGYDGMRYTSYDAFANCLQLIKNQVPTGSSIGFPHGIGCGLGGGNWLVISALIDEILGDDYDVYIYKYYGE